MTELCKENVCMGESSVAAFSQAYCESDIIVPDVNPDILKLLQLSANATVLNKSCTDNRISADIRVDVSILYLGDDENIYNISTSSQITHIIDADGAGEGMYADVEANVDNTDHTVLNSRKLSVRVLVGIDANASFDINADVCTGIDTTDDYEVLNETITPYKTACRTNEQISVKERLPIPSGKPSVEKILRMDVALRDKECSLIENKMMVQATLCATAVYMGDIDGKLHTAEFEIPLSEVVLMPDANEGMRACTKLSVNKVYYKAEEDEDGDNRFIAVECIVGVNAKAVCDYNLNIVRDAYCINRPVKVSRDKVVINKLVAESKSRISSKDVLVLPGDMPEVRQIFNITPHAYLGTAKIEGKKAIIEGVIESDIMYLSDDPSCPLNTYRHQQQFTHSIDISGAGENMLCDVSIDVAHSGYTISLGREIDLRFVLDIDVFVISSEPVEYVTDIAFDDECECEPKKSYCIKVYFVKKGDSLWSIAKAHRISKSSLMEINNISADSEIYDGRQIMIPIL